jgi:hypothetical protein
VDASVSSPCLLGTRRQMIIPVNLAGMNPCLIIGLTRSIPKPEQICGLTSDKSMALWTTHLGSRWNSFHGFKSQSAPLSTGSFIGARSRRKYFCSSKSEQAIISLQNINGNTSKKKPQRQVRNLRKPAVNLQLEMYRECLYTRPMLYISNYCAAGRTAQLAWSLRWRILLLSNSS